MASWILTATEPVSERLYLANGYMSTALGWSAGLLSETEPAPCYVRGVYNDTGPGGVDRLARVPCWSQLQYGAPASLKEYRRELHLRQGVVRTGFVLEEERGRIHIDQVIFASRADAHQAAVRLLIRPEFDGDLVFVAGLEAAHPDDIETLDRGANGPAIWLHARTRKYGIDVGTALMFTEDRWQWEDESSRSSVSRTLRTTARAGEDVELTQLARIGTSLESDECMHIALQAPLAYDQILEDHESAWCELWQTDVEIEGDPETQEFVRAGLYYLWSTMREDDRWSIAPMGLSSNGYNGHIFWDAELWMYPSLLVTQPHMARSCLAYREHTIGPARERAAAGNCRGARFPWEGAYTGEEMTPTWAEPRELQLHITADVAIAHWWYFLNTADVDWLRRHGYPIMRECAEYWVSRVEYDARRSRYEIRDVQCADEYAVNVDNDAFTNAAVRLCLLVTTRAAEIAGEEPDPAWTEIADRIYIPYDDATRRHLEFDGYDGFTTKQADVELLSYPLEYVTDPQQIARDLDYYGAVIDPNGPAMSFSVYSILSAQLGRAAKAYDYLKQSYVPNTRPPFQAFSETPTNNEFHFCTGIGGALQALLFGWTGLRLHEGHFVIRPLLPRQWKRLHLRNLFVLGCRTDLSLEGDRVGLTRYTEKGPLSIALDRSTDEARLDVRWAGEDAEESVEVCVESAGDAVSIEAPGSAQIPGSHAADVRIRVTSGNTVLLDVRIGHPAYVEPNEDSADRLNSK